MTSLILLSALLILLSALVPTTGLPTEIQLREADNTLLANDATATCSDVKCKQGSAALDSVSGLCLDNPCAFLKCPDITEVYFSTATNQCICKVKHPTAVLIDQATTQVAQQNATVYAVKPYFQEGVISFQVQLLGAPEGFTLNASTIIAAGGIGINPEPSLVLVPQNIKTRVAGSAEETALIIALTFNSDETITYHVHLHNGTVVELYGDKYVHDIDLIDPTAPPTLSILASHALGRERRVAAPRSEAADSSAGVVPATAEPRGLEGLSLSTVILSEDTCKRITCLNNGGQRAIFNPYLNYCQCETLASPENGATQVTKRFGPNHLADRDTQEIDNAALAEVFPIFQPSPDTCTHLTQCPGESKPYFAKATGKCLCVVYRPGTNLPGIVSDAGRLPRAAEAIDLDRLGARDRRESDHSALADVFPIFQPGPDTCTHLIKCQGESKPYFAKAIGKCLCVVYRPGINLPVIVSDTGDLPRAAKMISRGDGSDNLTDMSTKFSAAERAKWYLRCTSEYWSSDNVGLCLEDPYHYGCDAKQNMIKQKKNVICEKKCECGGINLGACLNLRGGCSFTRPDHSGLDPEDRWQRDSEEVAQAEMDGARGHVVD